MNKLREESLSYPDLKELGWTLVELKLVPKPMHVHLPGHKGPVWEACIEHPGRQQLLRGWGRTPEEIIYRLIGALGNKWLHQ